MIVYVSVAIILTTTTDIMAQTALVLRIKENKYSDGRDWPVPMDVNFRMVLVRHMLISCHY